MQTIFYMLYDPLQLLLTIKLSDLIWSISVALYTQKYESCYANTSDCYFPCLTFFIYTMPHLLIVSNSILQLKYTSVAGIKVLFCNFQLFIKTTEVTFHKKFKKFEGFYIQGYIIQYEMKVAWKYEWRYKSKYGLLSTENIPKQIL